MKTEVRERLFLPMMLPLGILGAIAVLVGGFAAILLWNTREGAVALALVAAGGVLFSISMLASADRLSRGQRGAAVGAGLVPLIVGGVLALTGGGVDDEALLNINRQPHEVIPEDAPVVIATNSQDFDTNEFTLPAEGEVVFVFDNQDAGTPHNVAIFGGTEEELDQSQEIYVPETIVGPGTTAWTFTAPGEGSFPYICTVHPNMRGTVTFSPDATEGRVEA